MNETMTLCLEIIFWLALFVVFYTYLGYGIVLYILAVSYTHLDAADD